MSQSLFLNSFRQGLVKFSTKGDRLARTQFEQLQDGKYVRLGYYDTNTDNFTQIANARWIGESGRRS